MANEVFRFMMSRPAQAAGNTHSTATTTKAYIKGESLLVGLIRSASDRNDALKILKEFLSDPSHAIDPNDPIVAFVMRTRDLFTKLPRPFGEKAVRQLMMIAEAQGLDLLGSKADLLKLRTQLADLLLAQTLLGISKGAYETIRLFRAIELLLKTIQESPNLSPYEVERILRLRPILPDLNVAASPRTAPAQQPEAIAGIPKSDGEWKPSRDEVSQALTELRTFAKRTEREYDSADDDALDQPVSRGFFAWLFGSNVPRAVKPKYSPPLWLEQIPPCSRRVMENIFAEPAKMSLSQALLETKRHLQLLMTPAAATPQQVALQSARSGRADFSAPQLLIKKGSTPSTDPATVPRGVGQLGSPRRGDLLIVRQELAHYQLGEIAHIENILQGETHERSFARNQTTESVLSASRETTTTEERDTQSTERFELSSAMKEAVNDHLKLEAGVSVSASYGPTVGVQINSQFGYDHSQEKSKEAASSFAREMSSSAKSKVETRVTEQRMNRTVTEIRELTRHAVDNAQGGGHVRGLYRWIDKVYHMQVVNYGIRDLYDVYVPEPAAFTRYLNGLRRANPLELSPPVAPVVPNSDTRELRPLRPEDLAEENYGEFVAQTGARDVTPAPAPVITVSAAAQVNNSGATTLINSEVVIPEGYVSVSMKVNWGGWRWDERMVRVLISGRRPTGSEVMNFPGRSGKVPFAVAAKGWPALVVTMWIDCELTDEAFRAWQLNTYAAIMQGYQLRKAAYDEQLAAANADIQAQIAGRAPAANLELIRNELKRAVITIITAQRFELFNSMRPPVDAGSYPEIMLTDAEAEGRYVAFLEQAFEWENMTFMLYPYFWGRKTDWPVTSQLDDVDEQFGKFLRAGFARVQLPVRPGSEALVAFTFDPNNWNGDVWTHNDPPGFDREGTMTIEDELRAQTGGLDHVQGLGRVSIAANDTLVVGAGTDFTDDDLDREFGVNGLVYRIVDIIDETRLRILGPGPAEAVSDQLYSLGPKLVGLPWKLTLPTTLVYLQDDDELNPIG